MIDNILLKMDYQAEYTPDCNEPFEKNGLVFLPKFSTATFTIKQFEARHHNLLVTVEPFTGAVWVQNSLHKYFKGNNYSDFTFSELDEAIAKLSDELHLDLTEAKIKRIEYGCNVSDIKNNYIQCLQSYKGKDYEPMVFKGRRYGAKCELSQYAIKCYDKTAQVAIADKVKIEPDLVRTEIAVKRMTALHERKIPIPIEKGSDLLDETKLQYLCHDLVDKLQTSIRKIKVDYTQLSLREQTAYARIANIGIRNAIKENNIQTYKQDMLIYKKLVDEVSESDSIVFEKSVSEKLKELLNS